MLLPIDCRSRLLLTLHVVLSQCCFSMGQVLVQEPYLDLDMCRTALQSCDIVDGNGGIRRDNSEFFCFVKRLGEERKCYSKSSTTGIQNIMFVNFVCNDIDSVPCNVNSELPIAELVNDNPQSNGLLAFICSQVDSTIDEEPCPAPVAPVTPPTRTGPLPTTEVPTDPPTVPTSTPTQEVPPIGPGFTLNDCKEDLVAADLDPIDDLSHAEYVNFLIFVGTRTCFVPDESFELATNATFNQHRCLSRVPCAGSDTIDLSNLGIRDFCQRSYNFALAQPRCGNSTDTPQPTPAPVLAPVATSPPSILPTTPPSGSASPTARIGGRTATSSGRPLGRGWAVQGYAVASFVATAMSLLISM
uniref:Uncharacterized protein n=1 Tax=Entomoneis paludosa TaxID=265537 RepID=A0A7S2VC08_9STRA|mmetsp:Transcript_13761/g.28417  ORF Transcript_13761/g.28417 Transcript_13761/m.28417 type:complete len:358 (+) Transcript_13761:134-1207(+)